MMMFRAILACVIVGLFAVAPSHAHAQANPCGVGQPGFATSDHCGYAQAGTGISVGAKGVFNITTGPGAISSVFARTGAIAAQSSDYAAYYCLLTSCTMSGGLIVPTVILAGNAIPVSGTVNGHVVTYKNTTGGMQDSGTTLASLMYTLPQATTSILGGVMCDGTTITCTAGVITALTGGAGTITGVTAGTGLSGGGTSGTVTVNCSAGTTSVIGCLKPDGTIITVSAGAITVPKATPSVFGVIEPDNVTITVSGGVLTAPGGTGTVNSVGTGTGLTGGPITTSGTVSCVNTTSSVKGCAQVDGTTIVSSGGVISAPNAGSFGPTVNYQNTGAAVNTTVAGRAAAGPLFNCIDYGCLGTNSSATIGTTYGSSLAAVAGFTNGLGATPFAALTNPLFGLTFTLTNSADCPNTSTSCTFKVTNGGGNFGGIGGWSVAGGIPAWKDPNHRNRLVPSTAGPSAAPNLYVATSTSTCGSSIQAGTTISASLANVTIGNAAYGKLNLSLPLTGDCPISSTWTLTIKDSALQALTKDWLGAQGAMAACWTAGGGEVAIPGGTFHINQDLVEPAGSGVCAIHGAGEGATVLVFDPQLGDGHFLFNTDAWSTSLVLKDLSGFGPGGASSIGNVLTYVRGMHTGNASDIENVEMFGFYSSMAINGDHQFLQNLNFQEDYCAAEFEEYAVSTGDIFFRRVNMASENFAGLCVASTNVSDYNHYTDVSFGSSPYGLYAFTPDGAVAGALQFLTHNTFDPIYFENQGNYGIYGLTGGNRQVTENNWYSGSEGVGTSSAPSYALPNIGSPAFIAVDSYTYNNHYGTGWGGYASIGTAAGATCALLGTTLTTTGTGWATGQVVKGTDTAGHPFLQQTTIASGSGSIWTITPGGQSFTGSAAPCYGLTSGTGITEAMIIGGVAGNKWYGDNQIIQLSSAPVPVIEAPNAFRPYLGNEFDFGGGAGYFLSVQEHGGAVLGSTICAFGNANYGACSGSNPLQGFAAEACLDATISAYLCPVYIRGARVTVKQKNSGDSIAAGALLYNSGDGVVTTAGSYPAIGFADQATATVAGVVSVQTNIGATHP